MHIALRQLLNYNIFQDLMCSEENAVYVESSVLHTTVENLLK